MSQKTSQPIFSRNIDIDKIAFLNWRFDDGSDVRNLWNLAEGFLNSAIELAKNCLTDNSEKQADILIFPILTNTNHGIELYLKGLIWTFNKILGNDLRIEKGHNIKRLLETAKSKSKSCEEKSIHKAFKEATKELESYILELVAKIEANSQEDKMDFSRYPFSKDYENHFYIETLGNVEIDLENYVARFQGIKNSLENLTDYLYYNILNQEW